jgi:phage/plasmid-like protein (TIGR03299 family)
MQNTTSVETLLNQVFSGTQVSNLENREAVADLLERYGLRWEVSKQELLLPSGNPTGFYGIVREDNSKVFATCKDGYVPFQNSELAELLIRISEKTGYEIHSGGLFNGGGKVYLQLNTGNEIKGIGKNGTSVKGFVTGINGHDGTTALKWGAVNFTICCRNTFAFAQKELQQSAKHTQSIRDKVEASIRQITGIAEQEKSIFDQFIHLSEVPVTKENIARIVREVTDVDITLNSTQAQSKYSTYAINRSGELLDSISTEMRSKGETLWGLFSGVTHYTSHKLPTPKRDNARLESKYTGSALGIDNKAFSTILQFA